MSEEAEPLLRLQGVTIARLGTPVGLPRLDWTVHRGEVWAITGPTGSGKSTLLEGLLGRQRILEGTLERGFIDRLRAAGRAIGLSSEVMTLVSFKEESWLFSYQRHYYQQRFHWVEPHDELLLGQFLRSGTKADAAAVEAAAERVGLAGRLEQSLITLSNGQIRRARLARALLTKPEMLLLDDPFMGLDASGRAEIGGLLQGLLADGLPMILVLRPEQIPDWVTHVLWLEHPVRTSAHRPPPTQTEISSHVAWQTGVPESHATPVVELTNVSVTTAGKPILRDITWTAREGERWTILGSNGSGKSTLLSLLYADHPAAYGNSIRLFGRQRGTGESIWQVKAKIGFVSPELHLYFHEPLTAAETVATGFFDVLVYRPTNESQRAEMRHLFEQFGCLDLWDRRFSQLATGEQRLVLLMRALVKRPPLVILDEPFQGLDGTSIERVRNWLDRDLRPNQTLLFTSHYAQEMPTSIDRMLRLDQGRVVEVSSVGTGATTGLAGSAG
ncbi:ATP-binding cassette domain-containing protein [Tuwongella immobilis]|uniref:ABC transporter domain-containing protein n=1 Tax=Tuwongella immobilis TaxID=692036 RepID=A0A6C2YTF2_9BACT|nr:ATP-binding cassette domain-containing protein [Tuwongella immobilis]VIP05008.1 abc transporter : Uncharacterized protein OS=Mucor circinelloides f. circinelloides (strain 1006PhL) GN=HMPREF1544_02450 PE=4 SV=1: ABC_tran: ABC_tran [Tuwongella immobilis]VTS07374.1 abc transporter : Uncharacterized protein OS=Mucor circinelloides f. circinelloides (strain 1006PhL) GN=HMPREF1544_02450 PE=4 SV=1: ABC_tran: ABC_tran [Tuwongella immobilis]